MAEGADLAENPHGRPLPPADHTPSLYPSTLEDAASSPRILMAEDEPGLIGALAQPPVHPGRPALTST